MQDKHHSINVPPNLPMRPHFKSKTFGIKFAIMVYMTSQLDFMIVHLMTSKFVLDILYLRERFLKKSGGSISCNITKKNIGPHSSSPKLLRKTRLLILLRHQVLLK